MTQDEQICSLALTRIPGLGLTGAFRLVSSLGSATRVFEHRKELSQLVPGVSEKIITALNNSEAFRRAEQELTFCEKNHIRCLTLNDEGYPSRLRECDDADNWRCLQCLAGRIHNRAPSSSVHKYTFP